MRKSTNKRMSKHWLVYANASRCNHYASLKETGFISWKRERNNFAIGDIVYVFSSIERKIILRQKLSLKKCVQTASIGLKPRRCT